MIKYNFNGLKRVNKTTAKKLYNAGINILIVPCKVNPTTAGTWSLGYCLNKNNNNLDSFENAINNFIYYNCNYNELGKYPAYYIKKEDA